MGEDKAIYAAVATFAVWTLQKVIEGVVQFRRTMRARLLDTSQLLNDIRTNLDTTKKFVGVLEAELTGDPCPFEDKLKSDPEYYIFSASAESTIEVFRSDAVQRYSHFGGRNESDLSIRALESIFPEPPEVEAFLKDNWRAGRHDWLHNALDVLGSLSVRALPSEATPHPFQ